MTKLRSGNELNERPAQVPRPLGATWQLPPFFAYRRPLLPFETFEQWAQGAQGAQRADRAVLRERLAALVSDPVVREALYLASPGLTASLQPWGADPESASGQKLERALVRYVSRMVGRPTPFGLFAATGVGRLGARTRLTFAEASQLKRVTRVSAAATHALGEQLTAEPEVRGAIRFVANDTLYRAGEELRFYASDDDHAEPRFQFVVLERSDALEALLVRARRGATLAEYVEGLLSTAQGTSEEEARAYVEALIAARVLVSELEPTLTCRDPFSEQLALLRARGVPRPPLEAVRAQLERLDTAGPGRPTELYETVRAAVGEGGGASAPVYLDLYDPSEAMLERGLMRETLEVASILVRLNGRPPSVLQPLRDAFEARFGEAEVRLVDVFDPSTGLDLDGPRVTDPEASRLPTELGLISSAFPAQPPDEALRGLLGRKLDSALGARRQVIELSLEELRAALPKEPPPLPSVATLQLTVYAGSQVLLRFVIPRSPAFLLARTAHGFRPLEDLLRAQVARETAQRPDVIPVEVVHRASVVLGHVLTRPSMGTLELPLLGRSGLPPEQQLTLDDLWLSVREGRFVLRSRRLSAQVLPLLSSAHLVENPKLFAIYRFLGLFSRQGERSWQFDWRPYDALPALPRVTLGRIILAPASWNLGESDLLGLSGAPDADHAHLQDLRRRLGLPRFVRLVEGENEFPVDLDNALCVDALAQALRQARRGLLTELFPGDPPPSGTATSFVNEIIVPALLDSPERSAPQRLPRLPGSAPRHRRYPPGSEWLYAKVFAPPARCDQFLIAEVRALVHRARRAGQLRSWFFLRYNQPGWHLRVRLQSPTRQLQPELLSALARVCQRAMDRGEIERLELDTWDPELERYGGAEGHSLAERWFAADSDAALEVTKRLGADAHDLRFQAALAGLEGALRCSGLDGPGVARLTSALSEAFKLEFRSVLGLEGHLSVAFRRERPALEALLDGRRQEPPLSAALAVLASRDKILKSLAGRVRKLARAGRLGVSLEDWFSSQLHMHVNRMLCLSHREHEVVLYDFLARVHKSRSARAVRA